MEKCLFDDLLDGSDLKCIQEADSLFVNLGTKPVPKDFILLPTFITNIV